MNAVIIKKWNAEQDRMQYFLRPHDSGEIAGYGSYPLAFGYTEALDALKKWNARREQLGRVPFVINPFVVLSV